MSLAQSKVDGMTVFNTNEVNIKKQPMFFGQPLGIQGMISSNTQYLIDLLHNN